MDLGKGVNGENLLTSRTHYWHRETGIEQQRDTSDTFSGRLLGAGISGDSLGNQIDEEIRGKDRGGQEVESVQDPKAVRDESTNCWGEAGEEGLDSKQCAYRGAPQVRRSDIHHPGQNDGLQREEEKAEDRERPDEKELELEKGQGDQEKAGDHEARGQDGTPSSSVRQDE